MTIGEFKAWLDGFSEAMGSSPNAKQWKRIQERLGEVSECGCHHHWWPYWYSSPLSIGYTNTSASSFGHQMTPTPVDVTPTWTVTNDATEIGRQEASMLAN